MLCATDLTNDAALNAEFSGLMSNPRRLRHETERLYMLATEIITTAGLDPSEIQRADLLWMAAALVAVNQQQ